MGARDLKASGLNFKDGVFSISSFSNITNALVHSHLKHANGKRVVVFRPEQPHLTDLQLLDQTISSKIFCQVGFIATDVIVPKHQVDANEIFSREDNSEDEIVSLTIKTYTESFAMRWEEYLGVAANAENIKLLKSLPEGKISLLIFEKNEPIGMITVYPDEDCCGNKLLQVAWVWVCEHISDESRKTVHFHIAEWIKKKSEGNLIQAGIHLKNFRSQMFFSKLGFEPACIHCRVP